VLSLNVSTFHCPGRLFQFINWVCVILNPFDFMIQVTLSVVSGSLYACLYQPSQKVAQFVSEFSLVKSGHISFNCHAIYKFNCANAVMNNRKQGEEWYVTSCMVTIQQCYRKRVDRWLRHGM
jgi:hypothetical protein